MRRKPPPRLAARPGAAQSFPLRLIRRMPLLGRWAPAEAVPAESERRPIAGALVRRLRGPAPEPAPRGWDALRARLQRLRQPIAHTARVVQAAREARKPKTRWERLREVTRRALEEPTRAARWENVMQLGVALSGSAQPAPPRRSVLQRLLGSAPEPAPRARRGLLPDLRRDKAPRSSRSSRALRPPRARK